MPQAAEAGQVPLLMPGANTHRVGAVAKLESYPGKYLYVRAASARRSSSICGCTTQSVDEFNRLRKARGGLKIAHGLMYLDDLDDGRCWPPSGSACGSRDASWRRSAA